MAMPLCQRKLLNAFHVRSACRRADDGEPSFRGARPAERGAIAICHRAAKPDRVMMMASYRSIHDLHASACVYAKRMRTPARRPIIPKSMRPSATSIRCPKNRSLRHQAKAHKSPASNNTQHAFETKPCTAPLGVSIVVVAAFRPLLTPMPDVSEIRKGRSNSQPRHISTHLT